MTNSDQTLWTIAAMGRSNWQILGIILGLAAASLVGFIAALPWIVQPFLRIVLSAHYRFKVIGAENVPRTGPAMIVSNHMSWFDGFFVAATLPRRGTALVNSGVFTMPVIGYLARRCGLIPIPYVGPKGQRAAIEACRNALDGGQVLGIFPEGELSRTGMTGSFHRGLEVILAKREQVPVIPVYLDNVWGSIMSHSGGTFVWKRPEGWRRTVVVSFGPPIPPPVTAFTARQAVLVQGVKARGQLARPPRRPEPIDPILPHFEHPELGPLTGSAADIHEPQYGLHQIGSKPGSIGLALPGVAIRAVDDAGQPVAPDVEGQLQALVPGRADWSEIGHRGTLDGSGFVTLAGATVPEPADPGKP